jgi:hypothetical protein
VGFDSVCESVVQELKGVDVLKVSRGGRHDLYKSADWKGPRSVVDSTTHRCAEQMVPLLREMKRVSGIRR